MKIEIKKPYICGLFLCEECRGETFFSAVCFRCKKRFHRDHLVQIRDMGFTIDVLILCKNCVLEYRVIKALELDYLEYALGKKK